MPIYYSYFIGMVFNLCTDLGDEYSWDKVMGFPQPRNVFALGQVHVSISQGCFSSLVPQVSFEVCSQVFNLPHCYCKYVFFYYCVLWWSIYIYLHTLNTNSLRDILVQTSLQLILLFNLICFLELSKNKWLCEGFKLWFMSPGS